jgi:hypothetical protein
MKVSRLKIMVDGKWNGGTYATEHEAKVEAARLRKSPDQKIEIVPKGGPVTAPAPTGSSRSSK